MTVAPTTASFTTLGHRHWLSGNHGFVDVAPALDNHAIDGDFLTGPDAQHVALLHFIHRHVLFLAVADAMRGFGREPEQRLDGLSGAVARLGFEHLSK